MHNIESDRNTASTISKERRTSEDKAKYWCCPANNPDIAVQSQFEYTPGMTTAPISYIRHHFSPAIIEHVVWLYVRFNLSFREVEET